MSNSRSPAQSAAASAKNNFPPPKNDKPRPHVCGTCARSFARLEHLKRHERSHTKEKPFECPECQRCFARRDLLLRHQQKLHLTAAPAKGRNRRESIAGSSAAATGRVRKNSIANAAPAAVMRPRANTISHVDAVHPYLQGGAGDDIANGAAASSSASTVTSPRSLAHGHNRHQSLLGLPMQNDYAFGGMSAVMGQRSLPPGLPKLNTHHAFHQGEYGGTLRTAPVHGAFPSDLDFEHLLFGPGNTINPNALHYNDSPPAVPMDARTPFARPVASMSAGATSLDDPNYDWLHGFEHQMSFTATNEQAVDEPSPSAISTASPSGISEVMLDGSNHPGAPATAVWQQTMMGPHMMTPFAVDLAHGGSLSPAGLQSLSTAHDPYFSTSPPSMNPISPSLMHAISTQQFNAMINVPDTPVPMTATMHQAGPAATITESTRQALLTALAQCALTGGSASRKSSFSSSSSPNAPQLAARSLNQVETHRPLPSTHHLQRYIRAYVRHFHPHLPFLHIPTLSFEVPAHTNDGRGNARSIGGRGCLILSMAAIGAVYELDHAQSKELFDAAKKLLHLYLEERRKSDARRAETIDAGESTLHTPVWLVQAMLLNVLYGHNIGDKSMAEVARTHCSALVNLAKAADLLTSRRPSRPVSQDVQMSGDGMPLEGSPTPEVSGDQQDWYSWKAREERRRTLYAVFVMSSLLVSAYNHTPTLTNSEIKLPLPCAEDFWSAESAGAFYNKGGAKAAEQGTLAFHEALGELLRTSEVIQAISREPAAGALDAQGLPPSNLAPSTFGCLILINALHNYIWETRQRHAGQVWTDEDLETMHRQIEPALRAWQAAWSRNPQHSLERPNPFGHGPLSADSMPLFDLAYVRLYVDLARSKEKFWQRDYNGMSEELSSGFGFENLPRADQSPLSGTDSEPSDVSASSSVFIDSPPTSTSSPRFNGGALSRKSSQAAMYALSASLRERHLRNAAVHAVESLAMSDKLGVNFSDLAARDLPLQSAMCAFDCAQVLGEWLTTLQERVGRYTGVLGRDQIDFEQISQMDILEDLDFQIINKVQEVLNNAEVKMNFETTGNAPPMTNHQRPSSVENLGYGCKVLRVTAHMLEKGAVWPVTRLMAASLEVQANCMKTRTGKSVSTRAQAPF